MDAGFWHEKWRQGQIGFHASRPQDLLVEHVAALHAEASRHARDPAAMGIYVPLCGKSLDLHFLRGAGFAEVIGTELSPLAVESFFAESGLAPKVREHEGWREYVVPAGAKPTTGPMFGKAETVCALRMIQGDIFTLPAGAIPRCDAVYDRAALVAMDPSRRERYVAHLRALVHPTAPLFLMAFSYDTGRMAGPPFSVDESVVNACFPAPARPERLATRELIDTEPRFRERGLDSIREDAWLIRRGG
jgi:thiopurine S-methyltransferase